MAEIAAYCRAECHGTVPVPNELAYEPIDQNVGYAGNAAGDFVYLC
jgi:hypothetical protein